MSINLVRSKLDVSFFNTTNIVDMRSMFSGYGIKYSDISSFDFTNVHTVLDMYKDCNKLEFIYLMQYDVQTLPDDPSIPNNPTWIFVPLEYVDIYKAAPIWEKYKDQIWGYDRDGINPAEAGGIEAGETYTGQQVPQDNVGA